MLQVGALAVVGVLTSVTAGVAGWAKLGA
jgi:hypothetical protein